jgi:hypothetical protein
VVKAAIDINILCLPEIVMAQPEFLASDITYQNQNHAACGTIVALFLN